jgi:acetyltransferase-like isoleucine patch superfamily enzyme
MEKITFIDLLKMICYHPHPETRKGNISFADGLLDFKNQKINARFHSKAMIDLTGDVYIGKWTMIGEGSQIFTHDHYHDGRKPLLQVQDEKGVKWKNKVIGDDVWIHGAIILYQVTLIPDGVVVGAGSVLTKNPGPYEIWAGNPARKIGERQI